MTIRTPKPPSTLLMGPTGTGKTDSLITYIEAGVETFVIGTEPGYEESLIDSLQRRGLPIDRLHWHSVDPVAADNAGLRDMVTKIGNLGYKELQDLKVGIGKTATRECGIKLLDAMDKFHCEHCDKDFGDVTAWNSTRALCIDSLSGLSIIAQGLTVGYKPAMHQGEWGVAMDFIRQMLLKINSSRSCYLTITAHTERTLDDLTGGKKEMVSTLGQKLAPKIPIFFSDVVKTRKEVNTKGEAAFFWSTLDANADLKNRNLPIGATLSPNFKAVVDAYQRRLKVFEGLAAPPTAT